MSLFVRMCVVMLRENNDVVMGSDLLKHFEYALLELDLLKREKV